MCFCSAGKIPEEAKALSLLAPATPVPSVIPGGGLLPIPTPTPPSLQSVSQPRVLALFSYLFIMYVGNNLCVYDSLCVCVCFLHLQLNLPLANRISAGLEASASVHAQPPLMGNVDPSKIDEIRRTVYVGNLNSQVTQCQSQICRVGTNQTNLLSPETTLTLQQKCDMKCLKWKQKGKQTGAGEILVQG